MIARLRAAGVRTVVWVTPWVNLDSLDGQRPPDAELRSACTASPRPTTTPAPSGTSCAAPDGEPLRGALVDGHRLAGRLHLRPRPRRGGASRPRGALRAGRRGHQGRRRRGLLLPATSARFADGRTGARRAWGYGGLYRRSMQRALDEAHRRRAACCSAAPAGPGSRPSAYLGRRPGVGLLVAADAGGRHATAAAASGFSNWSHDVGGYLGQPPGRALPEGAAASAGSSSAASRR